VEGVEDEAFFAVEEAEFDAVINSQITSFYKLFL
jgi:hypothetical protein